MNIRKRILVAATLSATAVAPAAQANDLGKGLILGGIAAGVVVCGIMQKCGNKPAPQAQPSQTQPAHAARSAPRSGPSNAQRAENRSVQEALNAFGFNVGTPDGSLGAKSRAGISAYQGYMGYPVTGYLDDYQRDVLLESESRMNAGGGAAYPQVVAQEGTKGLLKAFNDPNYAAQANNGMGQPTYPQQAIVPQQQPQPTQPPAYLPQLPSVAKAPGGVLPALPGSKASSTSMAQRCDLVGLMTQTNQGPMQAKTLTDPDQALSEQFCEARSYAISISQSTATNLGMPVDQVDASCAQVTEAMTPVIASLPTGTPDQIAAAASQVSVGLGAVDAQTAATYGLLCMGAGYRQDDPEVAMAGTLMLVGTGQAPYGEMLGHQMREGFGIAKSAAASERWYETSLSALEQNAPAAFLPSKTAERVSVMRAAIDMGALRASLQPLPGQSPVKMAGTLKPLIPQ